MPDFSDPGWRLRGDPDPIDLHVGSRARERRVMLGLSQDTVAGHLGISFQQLQKYESGKNRISASRLYDLAHGLSVDIVYFFQELPGDLAFAGRPDQEGDAAEPIDSRVVIDLVRDFGQITSEHQRRSLLELIRSMAGEGKG